MQIQDKWFKLRSFSSIALRIPYYALFNTWLAHAYLESGCFFYTAWLEREINRGFLVNEYQDLAFSPLFLSLVITFFL